MAIKGNVLGCAWNHRIPQNSNFSCPIHTPNIWERKRNKPMCPVSQSKSVTESGQELSSHLVTHRHFHIVRYYPQHDNDSHHHSVTVGGRWRQGPYESHWLLYPCARGQHKCLAQSTHSRCVSTECMSFNLFQPRSALGELSSPTLRQPNTTNPLQVLFTDGQSVEDSEGGEIILYDATLVGSRCHTFVQTHGSRNS